MSHQDQTPEPVVTEDIAPGRKRRRVRIILAILFLLWLIVLLIPIKPVIPVEGASRRDWNEETFWYHPWGASGVHKGIDIFADQGDPVIAATPGLVLFTGQIELGGNVIAILGPGWRIHYYAHMDQLHVTGGLVSRAMPIGAIGTTGNAAGKPAHLHYSILTLVPYPWRLSRDPQGWKKMFYLDPGEELGSS